MINYNYIFINNYKVCIDDFMNMEVYEIVVAEVVGLTTEHLSLWILDLELLNSTKLLLCDVKSVTNDRELARLTLSVTFRH